MIRICKGFAPLLLGLLFAATASADWYAANGVLYQRSSVPYQAYYCGRPYTAYKYSYTVVTKASYPDWQETYLRVVNQMKKNEAFNQAVSMLLPQQPQQAYGYAQPQQTLQYPSQVGNTVGGFSSYSYARYGDVKSLDANRAIELQQQGVDNVTRMSSELGQLSNGVAVQAVALQNLNGERIGAIAEAQELRAGMREIQMGLKEQMLAQADLMRSIRPASGETFSGTRQGASVYQGPPTAPGSPPSGPFQSPAQSQGNGGQAPQTPVFAQYCGRCHGPSATSPGGNWVFNGNALDRASWGDVYLRIDPNTPAKTSDGRALRMPPEAADQPSVEQRRALVGELRPFVQL